MNTTAHKFDLNTRATSNGRIAGMSNRSPINRTIDTVLATNAADKIAALKVAVAARLVEAEATRTSALRRFSRTNTRNAATALRNADITIAALTAAARRLA